MVTMKICRDCEKSLELSQFYKTGKYYSSYCKGCHNARSRAHRALHAPPKTNRSKPCGVEGCDYVGNLVRGMCPYHYQQVYYRGHIFDSNYTWSYIDQEHRLCTACLQTLPQEAFYNHSDGTRKQSKCKECSKKIARFSYLVRAGRYQEALNKAESMAEPIKQKYLDKLVSILN